MKKAYKMRKKDENETNTGVYLGVENLKYFRLFKNMGLKQNIIRCGFIFLRHYI